VVAGRVDRSIVFGGVVIGKGERHGLIVFQDVRVGAGAKLDHVIVDKSVEIGEGSVLGGRAARRPRRAGRARRDRGQPACRPDSVYRGAVVPVADRAMAGRDELSPVRVPAGGRCRRAALLSS
jgi:hypothetical protein